MFDMSCWLGILHQALVTCSIQIVASMVRHVSMLSAVVWLEQGGGDFLNEASVYNSLLDGCFFLCALPCS